MKKFSLSIILSVFVCINAFTQIAVWQNGNVIYENEYAVDSITFIRGRDHSVYDFSTIEHVQERISGLYYQFGRDKSYRNRLACGYQGLNTDIEFRCKTGSSVLAQYAMTAEGIPDLTTTNKKDPWNALTSLIHEAGLVIEGIRLHCDTTQAKFAYALGEALTLRSFGYLEMIKLWGDIPLDYYEDTYALSEKVITPKVDRNIVFERIRTDLKRAAELMPWSENCPNIGNLGACRIAESGYALFDNYKYMEESSSPTNYTGRPNKATALALLARADMMYAGKAMRPDTWIVGGGSSCSIQYNIKDAAKRQAIYQEVLEACAEIIKHEPYKLAANYEDIFRKICADYTTYQQSEVIWEIPFRDGARGQVMNYNMLRIDQTVAGKMINTVSGYPNCNSTITIVPTFYYDFENGDKRRDITMVPFKWAEESGHVSQVINRINSFYLGKYRVEWMKRPRLGGDDGINYPIIRYADVMLMFSEASIGGISRDVPTNNTGLDGATLFNQIRARAGLAAKPLTMENIIKERAFEFCGEYIRKYDLMRWGILKDKLVETTSRLQNLAAHTGEFEQVGENVYYKYREDYNYTNTGEKAFVIDSIWGLNKGETEKPATYDAVNGWKKKNIYLSNDQPVLQDYQLYVDPETIDNHQYWPIFPVNIQSAEGNLWNDYGY